MSALLDSFAAAFETLAARDAAGLGESRRNALDGALHDGLPGPRSEAWKYTSLRALERRSFVAAPPGPSVDADALAVVLEAIPAPRMVFVDGRFDDASSLLDGLPEGLEVLPLSRVLREGTPRDANVLQRRYAGADHVFAVANAALAEEGVVIRADRDTATTLHLVFVASATAGEAGVHLRHRDDLRTDASLPSSPSNASQPVRATPEAPSVAAVRKRRRAKLIFESISVVPFFGNRVRAVPARDD